MMQSEEEHQEIPTEDAAVMPVVELRKRHRVQNLAVESRQKRKDRTREDHGSWRKLAAACRKKVSRHAIVAWQKRKLVRKNWTQENCGPLKEFIAARMRKSTEDNSSIRDNGSKQQLRLRKERTTGNGIRGPSRRQELCLRSQKILYKTLGQTFKLDFMKRAVVTSIKWRKASVRTLWRDRHPLKRTKKELQVEQNPAM
jgi:hypothetical protein